MKMYDSKSACLLDQLMGDRKYMKYIEYLCKKNNGEYEKFLTEKDSADWFIKYKEWCENEYNFTSR